MNLTFPHLGIPAYQFLLSMFFGLAAWNSIACEAGGLLSSASSQGSLLPEGVHLRLAGLCALVAGLGLVKKFAAKHKTKDQ